MPLLLTYLMPEAVSSFYTLLDVGKEANAVSIHTSHSVDDLHLGCGPLCVHSVLGVGLATFSQ